MSIVAANYLALNEPTRGKAYNMVILTRHYTGKLGIHTTNIEYRASGFFSKTHLMKTE